MAGRGRGSALTFDIGALGISRGEEIESIIEPPPLYPPLKVKPLPLLDSKDCRYMTYLREKMVKWNRERNHFALPEKNLIEKFSDKYKPKNAAEFYECDQSYFPAELFEDGGGKRKRRKRSFKKITLEGTPRHSTEKELNSEAVDVEKTEVKKSFENTDGSSGDEKSENTDEEMIQVESEEDIEETDYVESYFDNGENYIDEDENLDDE